MTAEDDSPVVRVTLTDVYSLVQGFASDLAEIKANLNLAVANMDAASKRADDHEDRLRKIEAADPSGMCRDVEDHEARMRSVERRVYAIPGAATVIALAALLVPFLR